MKPERVEFTVNMLEQCRQHAVEPTLTAARHTTEVATRGFRVARFREAGPRNSARSPPAGQL